MLYQDGGWIYLVSGEEGSLLLANMVVVMGAGSRTSAPIGLLKSDETVEK